jgi:hypothetical protein
LQAATERQASDAQLQQHEERYSQGRVSDRLEVTYRGTVSINRGSMSMGTAAVGCLQLMHRMTTQACVRVSKWG